MDRGQLLRAARVVFPILTLVAIAWQWGWGVRNNPDFSAADFFSFFTIESNIFSAAILLWFALRNGPATPLMEFLRGAAVTYMATTGVVYGLLLSGYTDELQTALPWVNNVVHRLFPLILVVDWLLDPPDHRIPFRRALWWLVFPLAYLVYSLVRGNVTDWYPYPFLDADRVGSAAGVALYCAGIAVFIAGMVWLVTWTGRHLRVQEIRRTGA